MKTAEAQKIVDLLNKNKDLRGYYYTVYRVLLLGKVNIDTDYIPECKVYSYKCRMDRLYKDMLSNPSRTESLMRKLHITHSINTNVRTWSDKVTLGEKHWGCIPVSDVILQGALTYMLDHCLLDEDLAIGLCKEEGILISLQRETGTGDLMVHMKFDKNTPHSVGSSEKVQDKTGPVNSIKETEMSKVKSVVTSVASQNKESAVLAAQVAVGKAANKAAVKAVKGHLPMFLKGYADTAWGRIVAANLASVAVESFAADNSKAKIVTKAMMDAAMMDVLEEIDVDGFIDSFLEGVPQTKLKKLTEAQEGQE